MGVRRRATAHEVFSGRAIWRLRGCSQGTPFREACEQLVNNTLKVRSDATTLCATESDARSNSITLPRRRRHRREQHTRFQTRHATGLGTARGALHSSTSRIRTQHRRARRKTEPEWTQAHSRTLAVAVFAYLRAHRSARNGTAHIGPSIKTPVDLPGQSASRALPSPHASRRQSRDTSPATRRSASPRV